MKTALAIVPAALILLAGCAASDGADGATSGSGGTATDAVSAPAGTPTATTSTAAPSTTTTAAPSASPTSQPVPTAFPTAFTDVNQTITDPDLKDSITVKRLARNLPWPAGYKASAQAYELVALEMTWTPSKSYTIPIRKQDLAINTGGQFPNAPDSLVDEAAKANGWTLLPDKVDSGDPVTGWVVFKVDPRGAAKLTLDYTRPAAKVSGSSASFPSKTFSVPIVG